MARCFVVGDDAMQEQSDSKRERKLSCFRVQREITGGGLRARKSFSLQCSQGTARIKIFSVIPDSCVFFSAANMMRTVTFIFAFATLILVTTGENVENIDVNINLVFPESTSKEDGKVCTVDDVQAFSHKYHNCFLDKKYKDGGQDLEHLVARILTHSKTCVENVTRSCRPNLKGFIAMMDQVIYQVKDYFHIYLEHIDKEKTKIKDLQCVERDLLISTYQSCFKDTFADVADMSSDKFQLKVESAISCTNKSHKSCSRSAQTRLNRVARQILGVEQPQKENIEEEVKQPEPPKRWYDSILQPFISMWRSIRSFFGF